MLLQVMMKKSELFNKVLFELQTKTGVKHLKSEIHQILKQVSNILSKNKNIN